MTTKWTPGPWRVDGGLGEYDPSMIVTPEDAPEICIADLDPVFIDLPGDDSERLANARLIAAAPDLYEALRGLVFYAERNVEDADDPDFRADLARARAALRRAEGET